MTSITLHKHHGLGNDFLVAFNPQVDDLPRFARRVCDRRRGFGADGLLVATDTEGYTAQMVLYNADGSRAEMSGNGIRCFAQAVALRSGSLAVQRVLTDAGEREVTLYATDNATVVQAAVDMGEVAALAEPANWAALACAPGRPVAHLSLGNPHSVVAVDDVHGLDLAQLGSLVPHVNLEVVEAGPEPFAITMRVHERGAGITEACGTGACASAWAAAAWGLVDPAAGESAGEVVVHMDGGDATVRLHTPSHGRVTLVGPAQFIGTVTVDW
jgi:diaminopimelate epimerase